MLTIHVVSDEWFLSEFEKQISLISVFLHEIHFTCRLEDWFHRSLVFPPPERPYSSLLEETQIYSNAISTEVCLATCMEIHCQ